MDLRELIRTQPMRGLQITVMMICLILCMVDGFDILVMAFVAPHLAKAWQLDQVQIGYLLSAGVFGMAVGSIFLSPLADHIGRRRHIILCMSLATVGMGLSAIATSVTELLIYRAFCGLFIGAVVASLNITVSEYCSDRRRGLVMGIYGMGLPAGVAVGGFISSMLIGEYGWQAPFALGAIATGIMTVVVIFLLPESIDFLVTKRPAWGLKAYNDIARRLGHEALQALPEVQAHERQKARWQDIFIGKQGRRTFFLWSCYSLLMASFYFANTWTAKLLADATDDPALGVKAGVLVATGGVIGAMLFALLSLAVRPRMATVFILFGGFAAFLTYANSFSNVSLAMMLALLVGICANGGVAAAYAISPSVYPTTLRATGVGWMIGFGRFVAIGTPILTGYLMRHGWTPDEAYKLFAGVMALAGVACLLLDRSYKTVEQA